MQQMANANVQILDQLGKLSRLRRAKTARKPRGVQDVNGRLQVFLVLPVQVETDTAIPTILVTIVVAASRVLQLTHRTPTECRHAIFDFVRPNVYAIADSNHGFKMIGVGEQVARILTGESSELLAPFAFSRFERQEALPRSNAPFPWM